MSDFVRDADQQAAISARREELADLTARLQVLQGESDVLAAELTRFERLFQETVGIRMARLDELEAEIAEQVAALRPEDAGAAQCAVATRARATASARSLGLEAGPESKESGRTEEPLRPPQEADPVASAEASDGPHPSTLKSLWRQAAKSLHPDRVHNHRDRALREALMVEANLAYERDDRESLEVLLRNGPLLEADGPGALQLLLLSLAIDQARHQTQGLEAEMAALKAQDIWRLKRLVDDTWLTGTDLLARMERQLDGQIAAARRRLVRTSGEPA